MQVIGLGKLRVEGGQQVPAMLQHDGGAVLLAQHPRVFAPGRDLWSADEDPLLFQGWLALTS